MLISIVTSLYNKKEEKLQIVKHLFLNSLLKNAPKNKKDVEVIILDDYSPLGKQTKDLIKKYLPELRKKYSKVVFERNKNNLGFAGSFNNAIGKSKGDVILVLNDDVYMPKGSLNSLVKTLMKNPEYGMVGPITKAVNFTYQMCKQGPRIKDYSKNEINKIDSFAMHIKKLMKNKLFETDALAGFCFLVKREAINDVGAFNTEFKHGYYEDCDLSRRILNKYKLIIDSSVYVHHGGINGNGVSMRQVPFKSIKAFIVNGYKHGKKYGHYKTIKHFVKGMYGFTGRNNVTRDIKKQEKISI